MNLGSGVGATAEPPPQPGTVTVESLSEELRSSAEDLRKALIELLVWTQGCPETAGTGVDRCCCLMGTLEDAKASLVLAHKAAVDLRALMIAA